VVIAFLAGMSAVAVAGQETAAALDRLMVRIAAAAATSQIVRFREEKSLSFLESPLVSYGRLRMEGPDKMIRETEGAGGTRYVVSSSVLVVEEAGREPREMRLDDFPALRDLMATMRALFSGDRALLEHLYQVDLEVSEAGWTLNLTPREKDISRFISALRVSGRGARIETIETREAGGDRDLMTILDDG